MSEEQDAWVFTVLGIAVGGAAGGGAADAAKVPVGTVQFAKLRLQWQGAKRSVSGELSRLRTAVESELGTDPMIANLSRLEEILGVFNEGLGDALDDLANADTPQKREAAAARAERLTEQYVDHIVADGLIEHVETNPFVDTNVSGHLLPSLSAIQSALASMQR